MKYCPGCKHTKKLEHFGLDKNRTGEIRGLLCSNCNAAIGDNPNIMDEAISYLIPQDTIAAPTRNTVTIHRVDEATGRWLPIATTTNLVMYAWGFPLIKALFQGDTAYQIDGMLFEYKNVTNPGDTVTVPTYTRGEGLSYYNGLANPQDFLRVPLSGLPSITVQAGYEAFFTVGQGNVVTCFAQTSGTAGILGRPFSDVNNSKVFGVALVATPNWVDRSQDIIFARSYFATNNQQLKVAGSQIGVTWSIPLL